MAEVHFVFTKDYDFCRAVPLVRQVHGFVLDKPSRIRRWLVDHKITTQFERPAPVNDAELLAIHSKGVIAGLSDSRAMARATEFPPIAYLPSFLSRRMLVRPQLLACDGTRVALEHAARGDWAFNLSGGFHHARPSLSHGFCLVNDVAWALHCLNASGQSPRVLILDLDLHQGDGNNAAFAGRQDVFTVSLHQEDTFPEPKVRGNLDRGLMGGTVDDRTYLDAVDRILSDAEARFDPEIVIYLAGTDPYIDDAIGEFSVSAEGLAERDRRVARFTKLHDAGLVVLPAGGYSAASPELSAHGFAEIVGVLRA